MLTSWISAPVHIWEHFQSVFVLISSTYIYSYISTVFPFHSYVKETFNVFFVQRSLFSYLSLSANGSTVRHSSVWSSQRENTTTKLQRNWIISRRYYLCRREASKWRHKAWTAESARIFFDESSNWMWSACWSIWKVNAIQISWELDNFIQEKFIYICELNFTLITIPFSPTLLISKRIFLDKNSLTFDVVIWFLAYKVKFIVKAIKFQFTALYTKKMSRRIIFWFFHELNNDAFLWSER